VDDLRIVWAQGFVFVDVEQGIPASGAPLYLVGSISKLLTDTAAMQLGERGQLDIDQPIQHYLPALAPKTPQSPETITLRQLMTHHSGLPRDRLKGFQTR
jgi:CubicO group peptidase (beta-lactamase class C family)